jgi:hypothetical protein
MTTARRDPAVFIIMALAVAVISIVTMKFNPSSCP